MSLTDLKKSVKFADTKQTSEAVGNQDEVDNHIANPSRKESCWNCYKLFSMADVRAKSDPVTSKVT